MKRTNKFAKLSPEDRQFVHELCEEYTYAEAVEILERPRPEGLSLETRTDIHDPIWDRMNRLEMEALEMDEYDREIERAQSGASSVARPAYREPMVSLGL